MGIESNDKRINTSIVQTQPANPVILPKCMISVYVGVFCYTLLDAEKSKFCFKLISLGLWGNDESAGLLCLF